MGYYKEPSRDDLRLAKHFIKYLKRVGVESGLWNLEEMGIINFLGKGAERRVYTIEGVDGFVFKADRTDTDWRENKCRSRLECYIYMEAKKEGYEEYFAPTYYLGRIGKVSFSLQNTMCVCEDNAYNKLCEYIDNNIDEFQYYCCDDDEEQWIDYNGAISDMCDYEIICILMGAPRRGFEDFLDDHRVNDLHTGNYGIDSYGNFVIVDYCGYCTNSETPHKWQEGAKYAE